MKKKIFLVVAALLSSGLWAVDFGFKVGGNFSTRPNIADRFNWGAGYQLGVFGNLALGSRISIQPELVYALIRMDYTCVGEQGGFGYFYQGGYVEYSGPQDYTKKIYENWLNLQILAKYTLVKKESFALGIVAGPLAGINVGYKETIIDRQHNRTGWGQEPDDEKFNLGAVVGVSLEKTMKRGKLILDLRYTQALVKVLDFGEKAKSISIELGYGF